MFPGTTTAGDTLVFSTQLDAYPASGWVLKFRLVPTSGVGTPIALATTASGALHALNVAATTTANWPAGEYTWWAWVEALVGGAVKTLSSGRTTVQPDPRGAAPGADARTVAERALAEAQAALAAWKPTVRKYVINGRSMEFTSAAEILPVISYWETQVKREKNAARQAAGLPDRRKVHVRLGRA